MTWNFVFEQNMTWLVFQYILYNTYVNKMIWIFLYYNILSLIYIFIIIGKYYEYFNPLSYPIPNQRPIYN